MCTWMAIDIDVLDELLMQTYVPRLKLLTSGTVIKVHPVDILHQSIQWKVYVYI